MLNHWTYISRVAEDVGLVDKSLIFLQSKNRNPHFGITGYLHCEPGHFIQYIEGPADAVDALRQRIFADSRHCDLRELGRGKIASRRFSRWDMAVTAEEVRPICPDSDARALAWIDEREVLDFMDRMIAAGSVRDVEDLAS